eukprot:s519_g7.t2
MLAVLGYTVQTSGAKFEPFITRYPTDSADPLKAATQVPIVGWLQIIVVIALSELWRYENVISKYSQGVQPGDLGWNPTAPVSSPRPKWFGPTFTAAYQPEEEWGRLGLGGIKHCRLAMVGFFFMVLRNASTGEGPSLLPNLTTAEFQWGPLRGCGSLAVLIDGDNVSPASLQSVLQAVRSVGQIKYSRIYVNQHKALLWKDQLAEQGVETVVVPQLSSGLKDPADIMLAVDAVEECLKGTALGIAVASEDVDFAIVLRKVRQLGRRSFAVTPARSTSRCQEHLRSAADELLLFGEPPKISKVAEHLDTSRLDSNVELAEQVDLGDQPLTEQRQRSMEKLEELLQGLGYLPKPPQRGIMLAALAKFFHANGLGRLTIRPLHEGLTQAFSLMERPPAGGWAPDPKNLVFLKLAAQGHRGEGERHAVLKSSGPFQRHEASSGSSAGSSKSTAGHVGAWNSSQSSSGSLPSTRPVDDAFLRTLAGDGRVVIVAVLLVSFAGLCGTFEVLGPGGVAVFFASGAPVLILLLAWWRLGDGVTLGFLASMYLHSTLLSVFLSAFTELLMTPLWTRSFPDCQLGFTAAHAISPRTEPCEFLGFAAWLCIPGMIEETFKAVWFFFRLRRSVDDVPETFAAGAGFEAVENLEYGLAMASTEANMALPVVIIRGFFPMHICWTGMIGVGLARRLFLPRKQSPSLFGTLWPAILLHGMSDYSVILFETFGAAEDPGGCALATVLELCVWLLTFARFAVASGLRLSSPRSCCCNRSVWEAEFKPVLGEPLVSPPKEAEACREGPAAQSSQEARQGGPLLTYISEDLVQRVLRRFGYLQAGEESLGQVMEAVELFWDRNRKELQKCGWQATRSASDARETLHQIFTEPHRLQVWRRAAKDARLRRRLKEVGEIRHAAVPRPELVEAMRRLLQIRAPREELPKIYAAHVARCLRHLESDPSSRK